MEASSKFDSENFFFFFFSRQNFPVVTFNFYFIFQMDIEYLFVLVFFSGEKMYVIETFSGVRHSKANKNANNYSVAVSNTLRLVLSKLHRNPGIFSWNLDFVLEK